MPTTPNLGITHYTANQANPDVTGNAGYDGADVAIAGTAAIDCSAGGSIATTATNADGYVNWLHARLKLTGSPAAGFNLIVPLANPKFYIIDNQSGKTATVKGATGASVAVATGNVQMLYCDGTDVLAMNVASAGGSTVVTMGGDVTGPSNASILSKFNGVPWSAGTAAPGSGAHVLGEIVWNTSPAADGVVGFICVSAGTPGTWKGFGLIEH
jgi:hypothetical protein